MNWEMLFDPQKEEQSWWLLLRPSSLLKAGSINKTWITETGSVLARFPEFSFGHEHKPKHSCLSEKGYISITIC